MVLFNYVHCNQTWETSFHFPSQETRYNKRYSQRYETRPCYACGRSDHIICQWCLPVFMVLLAVSALKSSGGKNRFLSSPKGMPSLLPAPGPQANDKTLGMPPNYRNLTGKGRIGNRAPFLLVQRTEPHYWSQSSVESEHTGVRSLGSQRKRPRNLVQETDQA